MDNQHEKLRYLSTEQRLQDIVQKLGFVETDELKETREMFLSSQDRKTDKELVSKHQELAQKIIDQLPEESRARLQIGLIVSSAQMYRERGCSADYFASIEDAITYAGHIGEHQTANQLLATLLKDEKYHYPHRSR